MHKSYNIDIYIYICEFELGTQLKKIYTSHKILKYTSHQRDH